MASYHWIAQLVIENPKASVGVGIGVMGLLKYILIDPHQTRHWFVGMMNIIFTYGLCAVLPLWLANFPSPEEIQEGVDLTISIVLKIVGLVGSVVASYAVMKKTLRSLKRKRVVRRRKESKQ